MKKLYSVYRDHTHKRRRYDFILPFLPNNGENMNEEDWEFFILPNSSYIKANDHSISTINDSPNSTDLSNQSLIYLFGL